MEAARLAGMTMDGLSRLDRWEQLAWIIRAERDRFPPPKVQRPAGYDAKGAAAWQRS